MFPIVSGEPQGTAPDGSSTAEVCYGSHIFCLHRQLFILFSLTMRTRCPLQELETGMLNFALNFMTQLSSQSQQEENILVSPLSIYGALALLHLGAEKTTKDELSQVLGFRGSDNEYVQ